MYDTTKPYKQKIIGQIKTTWQTPYLEVKKSIVYKKFNYPEYHHSDGIGSKGIYHWQKKTFKNAVIDAMAMNLNDLAMVRAVPYAIIDHIILPKDDEKIILKIVENLSKECKNYQIAITGGETAIHDDANGLELSITMLGFIKEIKENKFRVGDVLIGIGSSGLHSNGFTRVREVFKNKIRPEFTKPTNIYLPLILKLIDKFDISGMMHITGGAYTKLIDLLNNSDAIIFNNHKLKPHKIFFEIYKRGVSDKEMYRTFNCGIGYILAAGKNDAKECLKSIKEFKADIIGEIISGTGKVKIQSQFSNIHIQY